MKLSYQIFFPVLVGMLGSSLMAQRIVVDSADPPSTFQGTTLNVTIRGKGFSPGAISKFLVTATSSTGGVTVNSTTFISSTALVANITAAEDAVISLYDIAVTSNGRTGKGVEKFSVQRKPGGEEITPIILELPAACASGRFENYIVIDNGADLTSLRVAATFGDCPGTHPFLFLGGQWSEIELPPGANDGYALDISDSGILVGLAGCSGCGRLSPFVKRPFESPQNLIAGASGQASEITADGKYILGTDWDRLILWTWDSDSQLWIPDDVGPGGDAFFGDDGNVIATGSQTVGNSGLAFVRSHESEPFEMFVLEDGNPTAVAPRGELIVGFSNEVVCTNRKCTRTTRTVVPVIWRRNGFGDWVQELLPRGSACGGSAFLCAEGGTWGVAEVIGKGLVIVGYEGNQSVAWIPDPQGNYTSPVPLAEGFQVWSINKYGWIGGNSSGRPALWKLP